MSNVVILGAQWGDEGKGKMVDLFSERFDLVARYQGGHNAGHTVVVGNRKYVLTLVPSGILRGKLAVIGNGLVIDPAELIRQIDVLEAAGVDVVNHLAISNRAHVIFPFHRMMEKMSEAREGRIAIGTTSRGIGPCYEDKIGRRGIRMADLIDEQSLPAMFAALAEDKATLARAFQIHEEFDFDGILAQYQEFGRRLRPMVTDTVALLHEAAAENRRILFEGAQGAMLDVDHGTYPFVTSSNATAGGVCTGAGFPPTKVHGVIGVSKAYITRVGAGAFPSEAKDEAGDRIRRAGNEFGTVTGRPRRCGWFDVPLIQYTSMVNGFDSLVITKLDVLDQLDEIKVCVAYRTAGGPISEMPATHDGLDRVTPVYECLPGWGASTCDIRRLQDLPAAARRYLAFLEERTGVEIGAVSVGPERNQTILADSSRLQALLDGAVPPAQAGTGRRSSLLEAL
ncbi:MAG: adenylosuccinate synthase [Bryobacteraceae bacterium]|nr:adenylosuccinate synthase [Bryobacteraceae bacterium]